ncbi:hypothetical protein ACFQ2B_04380 [Streptomyces stramineus]
MSPGTRRVAEPVLSRYRATTEYPNVPMNPSSSSGPKIRRIGATGTPAARRTDFITYLSR